MDYSKLITENRNAESMNLDKLSTLAAAKLMKADLATITQAGYSTMVILVKL